MNRWTLDPALIYLLRWQASARWQRAVNSLRSPRRLVCSLLAVTLGMVWIGQTVAASIFRTPADPADLQRYLTSGLLAYAIWNVLKTAFRQPVEPFEWTPAEQEWLRAAPLTRGQLIQFRFWQIATATLAKSIIFVVVLWADLQLFPCAWLGMTAALLSIDLLRMAGEIVVHGLSEKERRRLHLGLGAIVAAGATSALISTLCRGDSQSVGPAGVFSLPLTLIGNVGELQYSCAGLVVRWPFDLFARTILTDRAGIGLIGLVISFSFVAGMTGLVVGLDRWVEHRRRLRARMAFAESQRPAVNPRHCPADATRRLTVPGWWWGAGAIAWRQWRGAVHYRLALIIPLVIAGLLSLFPLVSKATGLYLWSQVVGSLIFYSLVLLPPALRFDFRRDVDRMSILKALPARPTAVVAGQLAVPVVLCFAFQGTVLLITAAFHAVNPWFLTAAVLLLVPVTLFIFVVENLVYLMYPYRLNQEGLGVFVRSILVFTGKSVLFGAGVVVTVAMLFAAQGLATRLVPSNPRMGFTLFFASGMALLLGTVLACCWSALVRVYARFDVSCDSPSLS